jgi:hypothetical protein
MTALSYDQWASLKELKSFPGAKIPRHHLTVLVAEGLVEPEPDGLRLTSQKPYLMPGRDERTVAKAPNTRTRAFSDQNASYPAAAK